MSFICSGTTHFDEVVTREDCAECSLSRENDCGYDYSLLMSFWNWAAHERTGIHVSDLTYCLRKSYYERVDPRPSLLHSNLLLYLGTITHGMLEGAEDDQFDAELSVKGLGIVGTADVVYKDGTVVDFKTTRWLNKSKLPYGSHEIQTNIYAQLLREQFREVNRIYIQYIDMSGPTKCRSCRVPMAMREDGGIACPQCGKVYKNPHLGAVTLEIPVWTEKQVTQFINTRREELETALETKEPPPGEPDWLCNYCDHKGECEYAQT